MSEITLNEAAWDSDDLEGAFDFLFGDDEFDFTFEDVEFDSDDEFVMESDVEESEDCATCDDCEVTSCDDCLVDDTATDCSEA